MLNVTATISTGISTTADLNYTPPGGTATYQNSDGSYSQTINAGDVGVGPDITVTDSDGTTFDQPANTDVTCTPAADATYENSDQSFTQSIGSGDTYTAPDITVTDSDGSSFTQPANTPVTCTLALDSTVRNSDSSYLETVAPSSLLELPNVTIADSLGSTVSIPSVQDYSFAAAPISYPQVYFPANTTEYVTGDAGWQLANGTFDRSTVGICPILVDNDTLSASTPNIHGTTDRFTDENGLQVYGNDYVEDHYWGLGIYRIVFTSITWSNAIAAAHASTYLTYTNWRLPLQAEYMVLFRIFGNNSGTLQYSPINITNTNNLWSCESSRLTPSTFTEVVTDVNTIVRTTKGQLRSYLMIRNL